MLPPATATRTKMECLPVEILEQICRDLCFHCQHPEMFPNSDTHGTRTSKAALARLSRSSKKYRAIAQPVLYHYYATGNLAHERTEYLLSDYKTILQEDDKLPHFLRTIIQRPDLAACIRSMQLVNNRLRKETIPWDVVPLIVGTNKRLRIRFPDGRGFEQTLRDNLDISGHRRPDKIYQWMADMAIVLTPRLETLLVARPYPEWEHMHADWGLLKQLDRSTADATTGRYPNLRTLALTGAGDAEGLHLNEWEHLFRGTPNLETLYAINMDAGQGGNAVFNPYTFRETEGSLSLPNLRKLVIENRCFQTEDFVQNVLVNCPRLEHIEYYRNHYNSHRQPPHHSLAHLFGPLKDRLQTLFCVKWAPWNISNDIQEPDPAFVAPGHGLPDMAQDDTPGEPDTLRDFHKLKHLSVDCTTVFGVSTDYRRLIDFLPPFLQDLQLTYIYREVAEAAEHLISESPRRFPDLRRVGLSIAQRVESDLVKQTLIDVASRSRAAGKLEVRVEEEHDLLQPVPRSVIPGSSVGSLVPPFPSRKLCFRNGEEIL